MDPLTQQLLQRQMGQQEQPAAPPAPITPTPPPPVAPTSPILPTPTAKIPQKEQRFENAQQLMESYRNDWTPNPMLLRAEQTK